MLLLSKFYFLIIFTNINQIFIIFAQKPRYDDSECLYIFTLLLIVLFSQFPPDIHTHKLPFIYVQIQITIKHLRINQIFIIFAQKARSGDSECVYIFICRCFITFLWTYSHTYIHTHNCPLYMYRQMQYIASLILFLCLMAYQPSWVISC